MLSSTTEAGRPAPPRAAGPPALATLTLHLLVLALLPGLAGCGGSSAEAPAGDQASRATPVEVTEAHRDALSVRLASVGSLQADNIVEIRPETDGVVAAIPVAEGQAVRRGALLLRLDDREPAAELAAAEAAVRRAATELANLEVRLERNRGLYDKGAISEQTLDDLEASRDTAAARLEEARAQRDLAARRLEKTAVTAPFAGKAGARQLYPGDYVREGQALFTLVDDDPLRVEFSVPEQYVERLTEGSPVQVRVRSRPDENFTGRVVFVSPRVEPESRTVVLKAEIPNPEGELRAGQFADVELELERRADALMVPESAIVPRGGENFVFVVDDEGNARERKVEVGAREPGRVEIRSGVRAGDRVVLAGQQRLRDGAPVRVVESAAMDAGGLQDAAESPDTAGAGTDRAEMAGAGGEG